MLFADDTSLFVAAHTTADITAALNHALDSANKWLLDSGLQLNVAKTKVMLCLLPPLFIVYCLVLVFFFFVSGCLEK